ncbi:MAG TPA: alpha/beta fold hydrolase [Ktedonobacteraceae bacterium]|jgi:carboxylesterase|nr:alpha/beta fold hydrolase [Ktedonobacteraceae bacterium]
MLPRKENQPFTLGPVDAQKACLLIHGFTGTASEMRGLGESLAERGVRVYGVALTGHSGEPEELAKSNHRQWLASAEAGLAQLAGYPQVFACGLSMGGMLSLMLAARHPGRIAGVAAMATPTRFARSWQAHLARPFLKWLYLFNNLDFSHPQAQRMIENSLNAEQGTIDFSNPQVVAEIKGIRLSVPAISELARLLAQGRRELSKIRCPLLIIHSKLDKTANPASANEIMRLAKHAHPKKLYWLEKSDHVVTLGPEREEVFRLVGEFVEQVELVDER